MKEAPGGLLELKGEFSGPPLNRGLQPLLSAPSAPHLQLETLDKSLALRGFLGRPVLSDI